MNTKLAIIFIFIALLILQGCGGDEANQALTSVKQTTQARQAVVNWLELDSRYVTSGSVTSDHRVSISSRISGYIRELSVREGDKIKKGDVLVRVDPVNAKQALFQAEADLADAKADLQRYQSLFKDRAISKQQLDRAKLRFKVAKSQAVQARNQLDYAEVISPVTGVVVEKRLSQGDLAQPGAAILSIEDPTSLLINTYVSEQYISDLHNGDQVEVEIPSIKKVIGGQIRQVVEAADAVSHQFLIKVALQQDSNVHPGMYARVGFKLGKRQALAIPNAAIVERAGLFGVYIVDQKGIARYRQIRKGNQIDEKLTEVLAGLQAGDMIAWSGEPAIRTGMTVQAKP